jgi:hypothetical protein
MTVSSQTAGYFTPVPETASEPDPAFDVLTVTVLERDPAADGLNRIVTVHEAPGLKLPGSEHVVVIGNSVAFELVMLDICTAAVPTLFNVRVAIVEDVDPTVVTGMTALSWLRSSSAVCVEPPVPENVTTPEPALDVVTVS